MKIEPAGKKNCVCHGLSVMRLALGYSTGIPGPYEKGPKGLGWLIENAPLWFPRHPVLVFGRHWITGRLQTVSGETQAYSSDIEKGSLCGFVYCGALSRGRGHFVIGAPVQTGLMKIASIVAVEIKPTKTIVKRYL